MEHCPPFPPMRAWPTTRVEPRETPLSTAADATFDAWLVEESGRTIEEFAAAPISTGRALVWPLSEIPMPVVSFARPVPPPLRDVR